VALAAENSETVVDIISFQAYVARPHSNANYQSLKYAYNVSIGYVLFAVTTKRSKERV